MDKMLKLRSASSSASAVNVFNVPEVHSEVDDSYSQRSHRRSDSVLHDDNITIIEGAVEGMLLKHRSATAHSVKTVFRKSWKRYFVFKHMFLLYYKKKPVLGEAPKGLIDLDGYTVRAMEGAKFQFIHTDELLHKRIVLEAESVAHRDNWVRVMTNELNMGTELDHVIDQLDDQYAKFERQKIEMEKLQQALDKQTQLKELHVRKLLDVELETEERDEKHDKAQKEIRSLNQRIEKLESIIVQLRDENLALSSRSSCFGRRRKSTTTGYAFD